MASLLCQRQEGGTCKIYDGYSAQRLLSEPDEYTKLMRKDEFQRRQKSLSKQRNSAHSTMSSKPGGVDREALIGHSLRLQEWLSDKQVKSVQEKTDSEAKETKKLYDSVLKTEDNFVKDVSDFLDYNKMLSYRKKEFLQKQWDKNVFQPIKKQVNKEIDGKNYEDLCIRKRALHKDYLEHVNKKGHVFLDTIAPDEYYPMALHPIRPSLLVAGTNRLQDPLLTQERSRSAEDRVILQCSTGRVFTDRDISAIRHPHLPLVPLGRHGTSCTTWLEMPMGDIESPVRLASSSQSPQVGYAKGYLRKCKRRMGGCYNDTKYTFSDWNSKSVDNSVVDHEMQLQKRKKFPMEHMTSQIPQLYKVRNTKDVSTQACDQGE